LFCLPDLLLPVSSCFTTVFSLYCYYIFLFLFFRWIFAVNCCDHDSSSALFACRCCFFVDVIIWLKNSSILFAAILTCLYGINCWSFFFLFLSKKKPQVLLCNS